MTDIDTFLAHYGVLGMKWGVRKDKPPSDRASSDFKKTVKKTGKSTGKKTLKRVADTYRVSRRPENRSKPITELSDQELHSRIGRLEKERKYNELNGKSLEKGRKAAATVLKQSGKNIFTRLFTAWQNMNSGDKDDND